jgi:hypothetical protein
MTLKKNTRQLSGQLLMAGSAVVVNSIYWLANVRPENKRKAFMLALLVTLTSSASQIDVTAKTGIASGVSVPVRELAPVASRGVVSYATGNLAHRTAGDLYAAYLGYPGTQIPATLSIDWNAQLDALWDRKLRRSGVTKPARQAAAALVAEYATQDAGRISLESYQEIAGDQATAICAELDWDEVGRTFRLNERETSLLQRVSCNMGGRVILAYTMAELLPSTNGELNRDYLDFLLRHGGRRYLESLPALHDDITSFGPVQFTQYAVYDVPGERRGASKVNVSLPENLRIPGSTLRLRGNDHLRAAYLFAISNLADGIRSLNGRQLATFERVYGPKGVDVAQYIAVAHNKPANGRRALRAWLDAGARGSLRDYCSRVSRLYATKTINNYDALSATRS